MRIAVPSSSRVVVVGPGRMGVGMSVAFALAGIEVDLVDLKRRPEPESSLRRAEREFGEHLDLGVANEILPAGARASVASRLALHPAGRAAEEALGSAEFVFEGVPEVLDAKREAFAAICAAAPAEALIASTTSSFLADRLAELVENPQRFLNTHWLNPAYLMPLVEVSPSQLTSAAAHEATLGLLRRAGKVPITVASSPGYVVPRLQALVMNEAARMLDEGVVSAEDLDTAARLGFGIRFSVLGPVEFIDWGGVDTLLHASEYLRSELRAERYAPPPVIAERVADGAVGMSAGRGLMDLSAADIPRLQRERTGQLVALLRHLDLLPVVTTKQE